MKRSDAERLIPLYFSGKLSAAQREDLFVTLLDDGDLYNIFAEQQALHSLLQDQAIQGRAIRLLQRAPTKLSPPWLGFAPRLLVPRNLAAAAVLALVGLWAFLELKPASKPRPEVARQQSPQRPTSVSPPRSAQSHAPTSPENRSPGKPIFAVLFDVQRAPGLKPVILMLPHQPTPVVLAMDVAGAYPRYFAVLKRSRGGGRPKLFQASAPASLDNGKVRVQIVFNSELLRPGVYTVTLYASAAPALENGLAAYSFVAVGR